jgi:hypothetical protein
MEVKVHEEASNTLQIPIKHTNSFLKGIKLKYLYQSNHDQKPIYINISQFIFC